MIEAINGIGHAAVATDPEFRAALAAHGFTMDTGASGASAGELVELAPYVGRFSARANQIRRNVDRYQAEWRTTHPHEEPGPRLREAWDRRAWAQARPDKPNKLAPTDGAAMVAAWNRLLHDLGYREPVPVGLPIPPTGPSVGSFDRDAIAELVVAELGAEHSAWNAADIPGRVEQHLAASGLITDATVRIEVAEDITARAVALCVPLLEDPGVPEHVQSLTSQHVLDVEADLVAAMAQLAEYPGHPVDIGAASGALDCGELDAIGSRLRTPMPRVQQLLHSPEVRSLPPGNIQAERGQWRADRAAAKESADGAALAAHAVRTRQRRPPLEPPAYRRKADRPGAQSARVSERRASGQRRAVQRSRARHAPPHCR